MIPYTPQWATCANGHLSRSDLFLLYESDHYPVAFCASVFLLDFTVKCIPGSWQRAMSHSDCGFRTDAVTLPDSQRVVVPPGLPEQISSPNHLQGNVSSRTAIYRQARWSRYLCDNESKSNFHQRSHHRVTTAIFILLHFCPLVCAFLSCFYDASSIYYPCRNMVNQKKHSHGYPSSCVRSLCLSARVKTSELFERWRNLQVCRWEQSKEETSNFK